MVKLRILVRPAPKNGRGICAEIVWATVLKNDFYRLENQPIHFADLRYHDIVKGKYIRGVLTFKAFVCRVIEGPASRVRK